MFLLTYNNTFMSPRTTRPRRSAPEQAPNPGAEQEQQVNNVDADQALQEYLADQDRKTAAQAEARAAARPDNIAEELVRTKELLERALATDDVRLIEFRLQQYAVMREVDSIIRSSSTERRGAFKFLRGLAEKGYQTIFTAWRKQESPENNREEEVQAEVVQAVAAELPEELQGAAPEVVAKSWNRPILGKKTLKDIAWSMGTGAAFGLAVRYAVKGFFGAQAGFLSAIVGSAQGVRRGVIRMREQQQEYIQVFQQLAEQGNVGAVLEGVKGGKLDRELAIQALLAHEDAWNKDIAKRQGELQTELDADNITPDLMEAEIQGLKEKRDFYTGHAADLLKHYEEIENKTGETRGEKLMAAAERMGNRNGRKLLALMELRDPLRENPASTEEYAQRIKEIKKLEAQIRSATGRDITFGNIAKAATVGAAAGFVGYFVGHGVIEYFRGDWKRLASATVGAAVGTGAALRGEKKRIHEFVQAQSRAEQLREEIGTGLSGDALTQAESELESIQKQIKELGGKDVRLRRLVLGAALGGAAGTVGYEAVKNFDMPEVYAATDYGFASAKMGAEALSTDTVPGEEPGVAARGAERPDPAARGAERPDPAARGAERPDPAARGAERPDPANSGDKRPDLATSSGEKPDPATGRGERPDPATAGGEKPDPATGRGERPDPATAGGEKPDPATGRGERPDPATALSAEARELFSVEQQTVRAGEGFSHRVHDQITEYYTENPTKLPNGVRPGTAAFREFVADKEGSILRGNGFVRPDGGEVRIREAGTRVIWDPETDNVVLMNARGTEIVTNDPKYVYAWKAGKNFSIRDFEPNEPATRSGDLAAARASGQYDGTDAAESANVEKTASVAPTASAETATEVVRNSSGSAAEAASAVTPTLSSRDGMPSISSEEIGEYLAEQQRLEEQARLELLRESIVEGGNSTPEHITNVILDVETPVNPADTVVESFGSLSPVEAAMQIEELSIEQKQELFSDLLGGIRTYTGEQLFNNGDASDLARMVQSKNFQSAVEFIFSEMKEAEGDILNPSNSQDTAIRVAAAIFGNRNAAETAFAEFNDAQRAGVVTNR
jgi:hypothetical protein